MLYYTCILLIRPPGLLLTISHSTDENLDLCMSDLFIYSYKPMQSFIFYLKTSYLQASNLFPDFSILWQREVEN